MAEMSASDHLPLVERTAKSPFKKELRVARVEALFGMRLGSRDGRRYVARAEPSHKRERTESNRILGAACHADIRHRSRPSLVATE